MGGESTLLYYGQAAGLVTRVKRHLIFKISRKEGAGSEARRPFRGTLQRLTILGGRLQRAGQDGTGPVPACSGLAGLGAGLWRGGWSAPWPQSQNDARPPEPPSSVGPCSWAAWYPGVWAAGSSMWSSLVPSSTLLWHSLKAGEGSRYIPSLSSLGVCE